MRRTMEDAPETGMREKISELLEDNKEAFLGAMDNDFNTAGALGKLNELTKKVLSMLDSGEELSRESLAAIYEHYQELAGDVLGIVTPETGQGSEKGLERELIQTLIELRSQLRDEGHYELADSARERLGKLGVELKDTPGGTAWELT